MNDDKGLEAEADRIGAKVARGEKAGMNGGAGKASNKGAQLKEDASSSPVVQKSPEPAAPSGPIIEGGGVSTGELTPIKGTKGDTGATSIVPPIILNGIQLAIDLSGVEDSVSREINLTLIAGVVAKRIEIVMEEGVFVSGTLVIEASYLSGIDMELTIGVDGTVSAYIHLEHEFLGFPTEAQAEITEDGIIGFVEVQIPTGHAIVPGLTTTGGSILLNFEEEVSFLKGNLEVATDDGLATGSAGVTVDLQSNEWSGFVQMQSLANSINIASGVDILLPEGFNFDATFSRTEGLTMEGSAMVVPQVTLQSQDGMEAGPGIG